MAAPSKAAQLMTLGDTAEYLQLPVATLYRWRHQGSGPRCMKVGKHLRYRLEDVDRWLDAQASDAQASSR